jgi:pyruvate dehydrogenase E2 component (dihydrolipoamide acetyltransferase)
MAHHKSSNPDIFILPDLGEGVHEAEMLKWRVSVGQTVKEHDILADMETDKAVVEVPSPRDGTIAELHGAEGEILHVGNPLVTYVAAAGAASDSAPVAKAATAPAQEFPTHQVAAHDVSEPIARTEDAGTVVGNMSGAAAGVSAAPGKALATPAVRRLARDLGVDIDSVSGSGIGGRVLERDVRAASGGAAPAAHSAHNHVASTPAPATAPTPAAPSSARSAAPAASFARPSPAPAPVPAPRVTFAAGEDTTRIPFRGVRRTIANRLRQSIDQAVHFTVMDEADCGALDSLRKKLAAASGEKVSFLPFVASAISRVLGESAFRALNATVDESNPDAAEIIQHRSVHLGIATDTENGLMVPVIRDCDRLGVLEISRAIAATANSARDRSIARENLMGSTFTISNVGSHAGRFATPVINYPEVAILAVGRARDGVVVRNGGIFASKLLPLSLACDHRVVDGATAALALARVIELLQSPDTLMGPARG